jgi:hypothetical protein
MLDKRYKNYWLDLIRKEKEDKAAQEKERQKQIATIAGVIKSLSKS